MKQNNKTETAIQDSSMRKCYFFFFLQQNLYFSTKPYGVTTR